MGSYLRKNWKKSTLVCLLQIVEWGFQAGVQLLLMQVFDKALSLDLKAFLFWSAVDMAVWGGKLFIPIQGCLLEVVREQYTDFYRDKERWRYLQKLDTKNRLLSLDGFTDSEGNPLDFITDEAVDIAETVVNAVMVDRLKAALPLLSDSEQELIQAIFFDGLSEREVGARLGITQSVVNKRKARILIKLRKIIEN